VRNQTSAAANREEGERNRKSGRTAGRREEEGVRSSKGDVGETTGRVSEEDGGERKLGIQQQ